MMIRPAATADAKAIARIQVDTWHTTYTGIVPESFLQSMRYEEREKKWQETLLTKMVFVADVDGEVVGFANGGPERTEKYKAYPGELYALYILEAYQGKGIGKALVRAVASYLLANQIQSMIICALEDNPACGFYEALGGRKIDTLTLTMGDETFRETVYGWDDIQPLVE